MSRLPSAAMLLGASATLLGVGCSTYPYGTYPGWSGGPGYPASCPPGYSCTPSTPSGGGWVPPAGSKFHQVWRDGSGLHLQLATREFTAWGNGSGAGTVTVDANSWIPRLQSDAPSIGWSIASSMTPEISYHSGLGVSFYSGKRTVQSGRSIQSGRRMRFTAQTLRVDLDAPDGLADGSKFNFSYENFGAIAWHRTVDSNVGPGVNIVANSDGSAAFIVQVNKAL